MQHLMPSINKTLQLKLKTLVSFLLQVEKEFDAIADEIDNDNLKNAIQTLAFESCQYAKEIDHELLHFNISLSADYTDQLWKETEVSQTDDRGSFGKGGEIAAIFKNCEFKFNKLYQEALEEFIPDKNLKEIMTCQFHATQFAFKKIMLLNRVRFNHQ